MNVYVVLRWRWRWSLKAKWHARWQVQLVICRPGQLHASLYMVRGRTTISRSLRYPHSYDSEVLHMSP